MKFTLRNYQGEIFDYYLCREEQPKAKKGKSPSISHLIIVVDCSGSMYSAMQSIRSALQNLLRVDSLKTSGLQITLISYASKGDVRIHFNRVPIAKAIKNNSIYRQQVSALRTRGLTCLSQGLQEAEKYIKSTEPTAIAIHSDGYANHPSASTERTAINAFIEKNKNKKSLVIHTIAHRHGADFQTLSRISNAFSGRCISAQKTQDIQGLLETTSNDMSVVLLAPFTITPEHDVSVFLSKSTARCVGGTETFTISGLPDHADQKLYHYQKVTKEEYDATPEAECLEAHQLEPLYAFCRVMIALGRLNEAKYALISTRDTELINTHYRALINIDLARMASDVERRLINTPKAIKQSRTYGIEQEHTSVLEICGILDKYAAFIEVDEGALREVYIRRTLKRVEGYWQKRKIQFPKYTRETKGSSTFSSLVGIEINRNQANINMTLEKEVFLAHRESGTPLLEVEGIDVASLKDYRAFTIVGDGALNVPRLRMRIFSAQALQVLIDCGGVAQDSQVGKSVEIELGHRPILNFNQEFSRLEGVLEEFFILNMFQRCLKSMLKGYSKRMSPAQIRALKEHYITPGLTLNFPTASAYPNMMLAVERGFVDVRTAFMINVGTCAIPSAQSFSTPNTYLERFYVDQSNSSFKWIDLLESEYIPQRKVLGSQVKINTSDQAILPLLDEILGIAQDQNQLHTLLKSMDCMRYIPVFEDLASRDFNPQEVQDACLAVMKAAQNKEKELQEKYISPLVFYIGATGVLPDRFVTRGFTADYMRNNFPSIRIPKEQDDGTFYLLNSTLISVFSKEVYYSSFSSRDETWEDFLKKNEEQLSWFMAPGIQQNIPMSMLLQSGWKVHYRQSYNTVTRLTDIIKCPGRMVLVGACTNDTMILCAHAEKSKLFTGGTQTIRVDQAGKVVYWYFREHNSMGFSPKNDVSWGVDTQPGELRLSWHLDGYCGGYRIGNTMQSNFGAHQKIVMYQD